MYCQNCGKEIGTAAKFCGHCGEESGGIAAAVPKAAGKAAGSVLKKVAIVVAILAVVVLVLSAYFTYFVPTPESPVENFFNAIDGMKLSDAMACVDPQSERQFKAAMNIGNSILGALTGVNLDFNDLMEFAPMLSSLLGDSSGSGSDGRKVYNISDVKVISITGKKLSSFVSEYGNKIKGIGNVLGDAAVIRFTINEDGNPKGPRRTYAIRVEKYGSDGWRIPMNAEPVPLR